MTILLFPVALAAITLVSVSAIALGAAASRPASAPSTAPARGADDLAVMTFNIRCVNSHDGANGWQFRSPLVLRSIGAFNPDLLGAQEVRAEQLAYLTEHLGNDYTIVAGKPSNPTPAGEHQAIFVRKARFEVIERGQFWLSETPDEPFSLGWDARLPRTVNWCRLKDLSRGEETILFLNTHFDHIGEDARRQSARLVREWTSANARDSAVILTGDFNAKADSPAYRSLFADSAKPALIDAYRAARSDTSTPEDRTFHGFTGNPQSERIDWIAASTGFRAVQCDLDLSHEGVLYPSDHFPVRAILRPEAATP